jgi:hypothetical protein
LFNGNSSRFTALASSIPEFDYSLARPSKKISRQLVWRLEQPYSKNGISMSGHGDSAIALIAYIVELLDRVDMDSFRSINCDQMRGKRANACDSWLPGLCLY